MAADALGLSSVRFPLCKGSPLLPLAAAAEGFPFFLLAAKEGSSLLPSSVGRAPTEKGSPPLPIHRSIARPPNQPSLSDDDLHLAC